MDVSVSLNGLSGAVKDYISKPRQLLIDGQWVDAQSGKTFVVYDPSTGQQIASVAEADAPDVNLAVAAARRAFDDGPWAKMKPVERARLLWKLSDLMEAHADELAELESLDNGKPVTVAKAADVPFSIETFRYMAGWECGARTCRRKVAGRIERLMSRRCSRGPACRSRPMPTADTIFRSRDTGPRTRPLMTRSFASAAA